MSSCCWRRARPPRRSGAACSSAPRRGHLSPPRERQARHRRPRRLRALRWTWAARPESPIRLQLNRGRASVSGAQRVACLTPDLSRSSQLRHRIGNGRENAGSKLRAGAVRDAPSTWRSTWTSVVRTLTRSDDGYTDAPRRTAQLQSGRRGRRGPRRPTRFRRLTRLPSLIKRPGSARIRTTVVPGERQAPLHLVRRASHRSGTRHLHVAAGVEVLARRVAQVVGGQRLRERRRGDQARSSRSGRRPSARSATSCSRARPPRARGAGPRAPSAARPPSAVGLYGIDLGEHRAGRARPAARARRRSRPRSGTPAPLADHPATHAHA